MTKLINRMADRVLTRFAPRIDAAAACSWYASYYCYCSGGIAYRQICEKCTYADGSYEIICHACGPSGTC